MVKNVYPQELKEVAKKYNFMWQIADGDEELIQDENLKIDFLRVNFYQPARVKGVDFILDFTNGAITTHYFYQPYEMLGRRINSYRGWEIFPKEIYITLMNLKEHYNNIPVYISENGMGVENEERFLEHGIINDQYRIDFTKEHLVWVHQTIKEGSNCFSYHSWAYINNWSWMNAYKNRYGFVKLDLTNNGKRVLKKSANFITETAKTGIFEYETELI